MSTELGTLEWINFNPDFLIRISTVETFHFCPNPLFFSLLGYPLIVFSNKNISVLSLVVRFSLIGCYSFSNDYSFSYTFKIILQDYVNLEIIKKRASSINPDIHHSKVFSSEHLFIAENKQQYMYFAGVSVCLFVSNIGKPREGLRCSELKKVVSKLYLFS